MTEPTRQDFRFSHRLRVRWAEIDMQKIVFNAHYLMYFDTAIADYWRALALPYDVTMQSLDGDLYVKKATVEYHASARIDDQLDVALRCGRIGSSSVVFTGAIFRGEENLVGGELIYVFADPSTQKSKPLPNSLREIMLGYEAAESMIHVELGDWSALGRGVAVVRQVVLLDEPRTPADRKLDEGDDVAIHALLRNRLGLPVATGRLLQHAPGIGRIGHLAVTVVLRGSGLGRSVVDTLLQAAATRGDREVIVYARRTTQGFFSRLGFVARGEQFDEVGVPSLEMTREL